MPGTSRLERKLQLSGILLMLGLLVEGVCLLARGPIAFMVFVGLGGLLFVAGILLYLYSLVAQGSSPPESNRQPLASKGSS
jgi:hypothetical protein